MRPTVGRVVLYHLQGGEDRPAIITRVWNDHPGQECVQLQVFTDGSNDSDALRVMSRVSQSEEAPNVLWATSVVLGTGVGEWSWPAIQ